MLKNRWYGLCHCLSFLTLFTVSFVNANSVNKAQTCIDNAFCFMKPPVLKKVEVIAIDSIAGQFTSDGISMFYDFGLYADQFSHWLTIEAKPIQIDGRAGEVLINNNAIALRVNSMGEAKKLSILLTFEGPINEKLALDLFKSIRFL